VCRGGLTNAHLREEDEVLEAGVQVSFSFQLTHLVEVGTIDMSIHTKQSFENLLDDVFEIGREGRAYCTGECVTVIHLRVQHNG
jgi:hypothetical protein